MIIPYIAFKMQKMIDKWYGMTNIKNNINIHEVKNYKYFYLWLIYYEGEVNK